MPISDWFRPQRTLVLFLGIMAVSVAAAGWLGWRFLQQDRALEEQRIRERLETTADLVVVEMGAALDRLGEYLSTLESLSAAELEQTVAQPGASRMQADRRTPLVRLDPGGVTTYPHALLPYLPGLPAAPSASPNAFADGERFEFSGDRYEQAISSFRSLTASGDPPVRAGALLRLARVYRKAGRASQAEAVYEELATLGDVMLSGLPASLIARRATCGLLAEQERIAELAQAAGSLRADLLGGKWRIDRPTFLLYSEDVEAFLTHAASNGASASAASTLPEAGTAHSHALAMAEGLGLMWREWRGGRAAGTTIHGNGDDLGQTLLLMWKGTAETATGLIGGPDFLRAEILAPLDPLLRRQGAALAPGAAAGHALRARRAAADTSLPWDLTIVSADPAADRARSAGRRQLFLLIAGLLGVLVIAGTYFSSRAVARELEMARLQSDFVSAVSHDFRTPLTSLRQVTEALLSDRVPAHRRNDYYAVQRRGINRLHRLVEGLLDFGRMEAGAQEFEPQSLEVGSWIRSVVRDFGDEVDKHGYTIELGSDASGIEIDGDEPALTRALWNVLDNAVKYSPDCRTVWVECRSEAIATATKTHDSVIISIRDRGLGIDPAERDVIFGKFVRGSAAATSAASTGTGLGLAMVEHIVQAHGGQIEIDGAPGKGTTFTIRLPASRTT